MHPNHQVLHEIMMQNDIITYAFSRYINHTPRAITPETVSDLAKECNIESHDAFLALLAAACGLNCAENATHRTLERIYFRNGVKKLDPQFYRNDLYCKTIVFPNCKSGSWEMRDGFYAPFEPFVWNHPIVTSEFREIPQIGYFEEEFHFPAVLENGIEWMTVTPNEIETMRSPIQNSCGHVLTLGLGLGYFAFFASEKETVKSVTVVERDAEIIKLFQNNILPQFPHAEKIHIEHADAFAFLKEERIAERFDYLFADLWHDQSDGLPMYIRLRRMQKEHTLPQTDYWIEPTLLSSLRHMVYEKLTDSHTPLRLQANQYAEFLSNDYLKRLAGDLNPTEPCS